jgi:competence protein ComEA
LSYLAGPAKGSVPPMNGLRISRSELAAITLLACGAIAGAVVWGVRGHSHAPAGEITFTAPEPAAEQPSGAGDQPGLTVHVAGAVRSPGLYELPFGARVNDAIQRAGGAQPGAYLDGVNLAAIIRDGEQIYVPSAAPESGKGAAPERTRADSGSKPLPKSAINVNTASKADLMRLPGVGEVTAEKIIAKRRELGRFASPEQLLEVDGIGEKKLEAMKEYVTVD